MRKALAVLTLLAATGCTVAVSGPAPGAGRTTVVVGYQSKTINTVTAGTLLRAKGFLEQRLAAITAAGGARYQVEWQDYDTGAPITAQMVAEKIDIGSIYVSHEKLTAVTGWEPQVGLREGLERTFAFYREHGEHYWT